PQLRTIYRSRKTKRTSRRAGAYPRTIGRTGPGARTGVSFGQAFTEPIVAWRLWHVRRNDDTYRLESFTWHHVSWPARTRFEARCSTHGAAGPAEGRQGGNSAVRTRGRGQAR